MSNRSGSPYSFPRDANRVPILGGVDSVDGVTPKPFEIDSSTGALLVSQQGTSTSDVAITNPLGSSTTSNNSVAVTLASDSKLPAASTDFYPLYNVLDKGGQPLATDPAGNLLIRGAITTDEGGHRASFTGSSLSSSIGTATFTNGSLTVTGSGFATYDLHYLDFIKLNTDAESAWAQVEFIDSDTSLTLAAPYTGTGGTGAASMSQSAPVTGAGATISVASGALTIASGTTNNSTSYIYQNVTTSNCQLQASLSISQRLAVQDSYFGYEFSTLATIKQFSRFRFSGTNNTQVITETGYNPTTAPSANEMETNTVTIPNAGTTATAHTYRVEHSDQKVIFTIDNIVVATHTKRIPHVLTMGNNLYQGALKIVNGTGASNTNIVCDYVINKCFDRLDVFQSTPAGIENAQITQIADGTNQANVLKSDNTSAGKNAVMVAQTAYDTTFTTTAAGNFATTDMTNYGSVSVHLTSAGTSSTVTPQWSNDNTNWVGGSFTQINTGIGSATTSTTSGAMVLYTAKHGKYFRLNVSGISAGTTAGSLHFSTAPTSYQSVGGTVSSSGTTGSNTGSITSSSTTITTSSVSGYTYCNIQLSGTYAGIQFNVTASNDGGTNYSNITVLDLTNFRLYKPGQTISPTDNSTNIYQVQMPLGNALIRVTSTAYTSGTGSITARYGTNPTAPNIIPNTLTTYTALPTAATASNLTQALSDKYGRQVVIPGTVRDLVGTQTTTISSSTSETTIVTAAASVFNDLTAITVSNTSATATRVDFRDTTAGSVLFSIYIPAGDVRGVAFQRPVPQTSVNTNWTAQSSTSVADLRIYVVYDKNR